MSAVDRRTRVVVDLENHHATAWAVAGDGSELERPAGMFADRLPQAAECLGWPDTRSMVKNREPHPAGVVKGPQLRQLGVMDQGALSFHGDASRRRQGRAGGIAKALPQARQPLPKPSWRGGP